MISIRIIFEELPANGEICSECNKEIKGTKYVMLLDFGDPVNFTPEPLTTLCIICKLKFEKE